MELSAVQREELRDLTYCVDAPAWVWWLGTDCVVACGESAEEGDRRWHVNPQAGADIHVVLENLSTHSTPEVRKWLADNPNVTFHFTPTGSSWLNMIENWFGIITRQSIRRGTFTSVKVLVKQIRDYITHWNTHAKPFEWTNRRRDPGQGRPHTGSGSSSTTTLSKQNSVTGH